MTILDLLENQSFSHHFQPIYDLTSWKPMGYEVLFRSDMPYSPAQTFQVAKKEKKLYELDTMSIHKAVQSFRAERLATNESTLFLNVFPSTILDPKFLSFIKDFATADMKSQSIVLELNETEYMTDLPQLSVKLKELRELGVQFAIDDVGKGSAQIQTIIELQPNYVKIDRYLTQGIDQSSQKQAFIEMAAMFCQQFNINMILEGIETEEELAVAKALNVPFAQGYAIGYPEPLLSAVR